MKIFIQNLGLKMKGGKEKEIPSDKTIRFENGSVNYKFSFDKNGNIAVYKVNNKTFEDIVSIQPNASNSITLK